jgi:hypothetical protein
MGAIHGRNSWAQFIRMIYMIELFMKMLLSLQQFEPKRLQSRNNRLDFEGEVIAHKNA